jgi:hypothetical protein
MKNLGGMEGDGDALAGGVLLDHVAPALPCKKETRFLQHSNDLMCRQARKL